MVQSSPAPRWRFLISPRWLAWHAFAVVAFWGMCWLGDWQLHRALGGNSLSWAYTFEWPLFAVMGAFFWAKTIRDELQQRRAAVTGEAAPPPDAGPPDAGPPDAGPVNAGPVNAEPVNAEPVAARAAHLARLHQEVSGHGRWHGLR